MLATVDHNISVVDRAAGWQAAIEARDVEGIGDYLHQDYGLVLVVPRAVTVPREEWIRLLPDYVVHDYQIHEQTVHVVSDHAAILSLATQHATVLGADRSGRFVLSDFWLRDHAGIWRVWRRHSTPASAGDMPRS
jgi:ketosteroid isomerase-like protein